MLDREQLCAFYNGLFCVYTECFVWSLIIFYIQKYRHIGPQFKVKYSLQGGSRGALEAKNSCKISL